MTVLPNVCVCACVAVRGITVKVDQSKDREEDGIATDREEDGIATSQHILWFLNAITTCLLLEESNTDGEDSDLYRRRR